MAEDKIQGKKPGEIYCPSCAKPIKKEAVAYPCCGVQLKEFKTAEEAIALTPEQELEAGRTLLGGIKIWFWIIAIGLALYMFIMIPVVITTPRTATTVFTTLGSIVVLIAVFSVSIALYVIPLVGLIQRKQFSVPFTRAMLVIYYVWLSYRYDNRSGPLVKDQLSVGKKIFKLQWVELP